MNKHGKLVTMLVLLVTVMGTFAPSLKVLADELDPANFLIIQDVISNSDDMEVDKEYDFTLTVDQLPKDQTSFDVQLGEDFTLTSGNGNSLTLDASQGNKTFNFKAKPTKENAKLVISSPLLKTSYTKEFKVRGTQQNTETTPETENDDEADPESKDKDKEKPELDISTDDITDIKVHEFTVDSSVGTATDNSKPVTYSIKTGLTNNTKEEKVILTAYFAIDTLGEENPTSNYELVANDTNKDFLDNKPKYKVINNRLYKGYSIELDGKSVYGESKITLKVNTNLLRYEHSSIFTLTTVENEELAKDELNVLYTINAQENDINNIYNANVLSIKVKDFNSASEKNGIIDRTDRTEEDGKVLVSEVQQGSALNSKTGTKELIMVKPVCNVKDMPIGDKELKLKMTIKIPSNAELSENQYFDWVLDPKTNEATLETDQPHAFAFLIFPDVDNGDLINIETTTYVYPRTITNSELMTNEAYNNLVKTNPEQFNLVENFDYKAPLNTISKTGSITYTGNIDLVAEVKERELTETSKNKPSVIYDNTTKDDDVSGVRDNFTSHSIWKRIRSVEGTLQTEVNVSGLDGKVAPFEFKNEIGFSETKVKNVFYSTSLLDDRFELNVKNLMDLDIDSGTSNLLDLYNNNVMEIPGDPDGKRIVDTFTFVANVNFDDGSFETKVVKPTGTGYRGSVTIYDLFDAFEDLDMFVGMYTQKGMGASNYSFSIQNTNPFYFRNKVTNGVLEDKYTYSTLTSKGYVVAKPEFDYTSLLKNGGADTAKLVTNLYVVPETGNADMANAEGTLNILEGKYEIGLANPEWVGDFKDPMVQQYTGNPKDKDWTGQFPIKPSYIYVEEMMNKPFDIVNSLDYYILLPSGVNQTALEASFKNYSVGFDAKFEKLNSDFLKVWDYEDSALELIKDFKSTGQSAIKVTFNGLSYNYYDWVINSEDLDNYPQNMYYNIFKAKGARMQLPNIEGLYWDKIVYSTSDNYSDKGRASYDTLNEFATIDYLVMDGFKKDVTTPSGVYSSYRGDRNSDYYDIYNSGTRVVPVGSERNDRDLQVYWESAMKDDSILKLPWHTRYMLPVSHSNTAINTITTKGSNDKDYVTGSVESSTVAGEPMSYVLNTLNSFESDLKDVSLFFAVPKKGNGGTQFDTFLSSKAELGASNTVNDLVVMYTTKAIPTTNNQDILNFTKNDSNWTLSEPKDWSTITGVRINAKTLPIYGNINIKLNLVSDSKAKLKEKAIGSFKFIKDSVVVDSTTTTTVIDKEVTSTTTQVKGTKTWVGDKETDRPESITVILDQNGTKLKEAKVTKANNWEYSFDNLPIQDEKGKDFTYTIREVKVEGYSTKVSGFNLVNTKDGAKVTDIKGTKTWVGDKESDRPSTITVILNQNGSKLKEQQVTKDNNWAYNFTNLPVKDSNNKDYVYTIQEVKVVGYSTTVSGFNLINTKEKEELITISGTKTWNDNNDKAKARPSQIELNLLRDGIKIQTIVVKPDSNGSWTYSVKDLPKKDSNKKDYVYTISEVPVKWYSSVINSFNIVNTYIETENITSITINKRWVDNGNKEGKRPNSIYVEVYQNGSLFKTVQLNGSLTDETWTLKVENLPKLAEDKSSYVYTLKEKEVEGYSGVVTGLTITNTLNKIPDTAVTPTEKPTAKPTLTPQPAVKETPKSELPRTGESENFVLVLAGFVLLIGSSLILTKKRKA